jgi:hypothetical protein
MDFIIIATIVLTASSCLADTLRFVKCWRAFVGDRKNDDEEGWLESLVFYLRKMPEEFMFERVEMVLLFVLRTLCTNMSARPIHIYTPPTTSQCDDDDDALCHENREMQGRKFEHWGASSYCDGDAAGWMHWDRALAISTSVVAWLAFPFCFLMVLNSFEHSIGPAPPVGPEALAGVQQGSRVIQGVRPDDVPSELTRRLWPALFDRGGANLHHEIFNRRGVVRVSYRVGGLRHVVRVIVWKLLCLAKLACGIWDRDVLLATNVLPRSEALLPHDLTAPVDRQPKGLQLHQEFMSVTGRTVATLFCLLPGGAILTTLSEAMNVWPVFVTDGYIDKDAHAVWADNGGCCSMLFPTLLDIPPTNQTLIVMNSEAWLRKLGYVFEVVRVLLIIALCWFAEQEEDASLTMLTKWLAALLFIWILLFEAKALILDSEEQQYFRRRLEWDRRHREVLLGGHRGTKLRLASNFVHFSNLRVNNAPLSHHTFPEGFPRDGDQDGRFVVTNAEDLASGEANVVLNKFAFMQYLGGNVSYAEMARRAADAGAIGVIIANSPYAADENAVPVMPNDDGAVVTIPVFGVSNHEWRRVVDLGFRLYASDTISTISIEENAEREIASAEMIFIELLHAAWMVCMRRTSHGEEDGTATQMVACESADGASVAADIAADSTVAADLSIEVGDEQAHEPVNIDPYAHYRVNTTLDATPESSLDGDNIEDNTEDNIEVHVNDNMEGSAEDKEKVAGCSAEEVVEVAEQYERLPAKIRRPPPPLPPKMHLLPPTEQPLVSLAAAVQPRLTPPNNPPPSPPPPTAGNGSPSPPPPLLAGDSAEQSGAKVSMPARISENIGSSSTDAYVPPFATPAIVGTPPLSIVRPAEGTALRTAAVRPRLTPPNNLPSPPPPPPRSAASPPPPLVAGYSAQPSGMKEMVPAARISENSGDDGSMDTFAQVANPAIGVPRSGDQAPVADHTGEMLSREGGQNGESMTPPLASVGVAQRMAELSGVGPLPLPGIRASPKPAGEGAIAERMAKLGGIRMPLPGIDLATTTPAGGGTAEAMARLGVGFTLPGGGPPPPRKHQHSSAAAATDALAKKHTDGPRAASASMDAELAKKLARRRALGDSAAEANTSAESPPSGSAFSSSSAAAPAGVSADDAAVLPTPLFSLAQLRNPEQLRMLEGGTDVDLLRRELYLKADEFEAAVGMTPDAFARLPTWKAANIKRKIGIF